jgi:aspartyl-tRNA(Asn)/glutamyl-tRNA(Gln) amidotransferase subunit A
MPLALQLVGRPNAEDCLLCGGFAYERATQWLSRVPSAQPPSF